MKYLDDWNAEQREAVSAWRRKNRALQSELDEIDVRVSSQRGDAGVSVDARGKVTNLRLTPRALRLGDVQLSQLLLDLIQRAQAEAAAEVDATTRPYTTDPSGAAANAFIRELMDGDDKRRE